MRVTTMTYKIYRLPVFAFLFATLLAWVTPAQALVVGVNGHDVGVPVYQDPAKTEANFQLMNSKNLRSYRVDVGNNAASIAVLKRLVTLGKKYNIAIRPMLYVDSGSSNDAYVMAKTFAADITYWELGNELNLRGEAQFTNSINLMIQARAGVMRAAAETGKALKTGINVTAGAAGNVGLNNAHTTYPFLDKAIAMGLQFDYITYHWYPSPGDIQSGWAADYLNNLRKYNKTVFMNETNCAQIYSGDDGNSQACADNMDKLLALITTNYADMIKEVNLYELLDNPNQQGAEAHFGIMFNINQPKKMLSVAAKYAGSATVVTPPTTPTTPTTPSTPPPANSSNTTFVTQLYTNLLGRNPDTGGLNTYVNALNSGAVTRKNLVTGFANSSEFTNAAASLSNTAFVNRLYIGVLGRTPDTGGITSWVKALNARSVNKAQVTQAFLSSAEFRNRAF